MHSQTLEFVNPDLKQLHTTTKALQSTNKQIKYQMEPVES